MQSMTFGNLPSWEDFSKAFEDHVDRETYSIRSGAACPGTLPDGDYSPSELYALVKSLSESETEDDQMLAADILYTLNIEWI